MANIQYYDVIRSCGDIACPFYGDRSHCFLPSLYYRVVVIRVPLQGLCATL